MLIHHDDERRRDRPATPSGPKGCGGTGPSSLSLLLAMNEHWLVVAPRIWRRCARNDSHAISDSGH
jgi:hypothetical protein